MLLKFGSNRTTACKIRKTRKGRAELAPSFENTIEERVDLPHRTSTINTANTEVTPLHRRPTGMAATTALREALNKGISSGNLVDTKIILYSHRDSSGRICRPKALYASSHVLKTVSYFNDCEYTATLHTTRVTPRGTVFKYSLGPSQSLRPKT